jgi:hypothetical protein
MAGGRNFSNPNKAGATSFGMASENFGYSAVRLKRVKKLQFGVVNPDELVSFVKAEKSRLSFGTMRSVLAIAFIHSSAA